MVEPIYVTTNTTIDLNVVLIQQVKDVRLPAFVRLGAAFCLVEDIERQLTPEERKQLEEEDDVSDV